MKHWATSLVLLTIYTLILTSLPNASAATGARHANDPVGIPSEPPDQAQAGQALKQGRALLKRGQAAQALDLLQNALKLFKQEGNNKGEAAANDALGDLYLRQGQYGVALNHYQSAHEAFKSAAQKQGVLESTVGIPDNEYNANLMLAKVGETHYRQGKISEASAAYTQMRVEKPDPTKLGQPKKSGGLLGRLPTSVIPGASLVQTIQGAVELYRQTILFSIQEIGLGRIDYFNNQFDGSKKHFDNALSVASMPILGKFGQSRRVRAAARTSLGDIALRQGRYKDAVKLYSDAAKGAREDKRLDLMWPAQRGLGRGRWLQASQEKDSAKATKTREEAIASYREALQTIETIRQGSVRADDARTTFLATTKDVYDEASSALAEMALMSAPSSDAPLQGPALTYAAEAFKIVEQGRARSLLDLLGEAGADITEGVPPDLLKRKQENLDRQQEIAQILTGVTAVEGEGKPNVEKLDAELESLSTEYDNIENQIRAASPRYAALTAPQPLALAEVQQKVLDDQTVLLEYSLGDDHSYLWAVTQGGVSLYKLPARSAINQQAQDFRAQLIPPKLQRRIVGIDVSADQQRGLGLSTAPPLSEGASAYATASNALYKTVIGPAASVIGDKRLLVIADGALNYVPFEALVKTAGGADYASLPYLIKTNEIVYAPSASVVAVMRGLQSGKPTGKNLLIIADPIFSPKDPRATGKVAATPEAGAEARGLGLDSALSDMAGTPAGGSAPEKGLQLARLNGTRMEAEQIAKLTRAAGGQADVWLDLEAREENVRTRDIKKYRVVHIATHGLLNAERPQFTGLVLSLIGNKSGDGFLRTDEVFNLDLGASLVMLSACETGLGKEKRGEGVIGLTRAFMYAGAPTVGVSLWSVADKSTAELMTDFYKRLLSTPNASPSGALRAAQQAMIEGKRYSAPFYWAPFVLVGEWRG